MASRWLSVVLLFNWIAGSPVTSRAQQAPKHPPERSSAGQVRPLRLKLRTNAFRDAGRLPLKYTCWAPDDQIVSPPLQWSNAPTGSKSFTLMLTGPENLRRSLQPDFYWVRWNIPASTTEVPEGVPQGAELPDGSRQVKSEVVVGYNPPCAPAGAGELHQEFKLFALDTMLTLPSNAIGEDVLKAIDGHILGVSVYYSTLCLASTALPPRTCKPDSVE
jgi:Raf kinase inhibitor-like YbhB/YbcL family protein